MIDLLCIPACVFLNRIRGWGSSRIPGRTLYYVAPVVGLLAGLLSGSWQLGLAWGVGYLAWGIPGWSHWWDTGTEPDLNDRLTASYYAIQWVADRLPLPPGLHRDHVALWVRHMLALPGAIAAAWVAGLWWSPLLVPVFAAGTVAVYHAAWRQVTALNPVVPAELATGALWGLLLLPTL